MYMSVVPQGSDMGFFYPRAAWNDASRIENLYEPCLWYDFEEKEIMCDIFSSDMHLCFGRGTENEKKANE